MGRNYSANHDDYKLLEEVGHGASATVYRAIYLPTNDVVAVKCLDLDRCNSNLVSSDFQFLYDLFLPFLQDDIRREAQTMSLIDHPNIIKAYCSFVVDHYLWVVMQFMAEGSCLHLMKIAYQEGFEEAAIASILKETLKALEYLHRHGHIHRDVKAGNILMDKDSVVKLADFGVSACLFDRGDRQRSRNTFVGTPCWMAPEVLQPGTGYDSKADIWSFGITALELAHGHAPFSKYPPMKVLLMTIQNAPPGLDYDRDKKFSKSFKEMVAMCLVKDQTKRPTAEKLLKHFFFKNAKPPELSVKKLFANLPPLWKRVKEIQLKDEAQLALKRMPSAEQEAMSQSEYQRGVSAWNFDIEDLKHQASLMRDDDEIQETNEEDNLKLQSNYKDTFSSEMKAVTAPFDSGREKSICDEAHIDDSQTRLKKESEIDIIESDTIEDDRLGRSGSKAEEPPTLGDNDTAQAKTTRDRPRKSQSGPLIPDIVRSNTLADKTHYVERADTENHLGAERPQLVRRAPSFSGPLNLPNRASGNSLSAPIKSTGVYKDSFEDKSKSNLVQKGRFSVTSEIVDLVKGSPLRKSASLGSRNFDAKQMANTQLPKEIGNTPVPASVLLPHLQNLFQQTSIQQDLIMNLLSSFQPVEVENAPQTVQLPPLPRRSESNGNIEANVSEKERLLMMKISELQARYAYHDY